MNLDLNNGINGFGNGTQADVQQLNKALEAGYVVNPLDLEGGGAFRVESLENSLHILSYGEQHIKFWNKIPKEKAYSTVEQYGQLLSYGRGQGAFVGEGQLPSTNDSTYARKAAFVKFLGTTREVTHPMTLVNSAFGNVIARQNQDGILWMLKQVEQSLFWGNSKLKPAGEEGKEFDGIDRMIDPANTIDLSGTYLEEKHLNWGAQMIIQNYGTPTDVFLPFEVMAQFSQEFFPKERVIMPTANGYQAGVVVNKFMTHGGEVDFNPDIFLTKTRPINPNASSFKAPAVGTAALNATPLTGTSGNFGAQGSGTYTYAVTFNNDEGESIPTASFNIALASTDLAKGVQIDITNPASTSFPVDYIRIYRSEKDGSALYEVAKIPVASTGASAVTTYVDNGETIANTYTCFMGEMSPDVLAFKQLAPLMKMDLATLGPVIRWMILMYGVPVIYAPKKWMRFKNVKADVPGFIGA
jgi:hypothetical protein